MEFPNSGYLFEFKCNQNAETAIRQIQKKHYADRFRQKGKKIALIGITFDTKKRNLAEWNVVTI